MDHIPVEAAKPSAEVSTHSPGSICSARPMWPGASGKECLDLETSEDAFGLCL